MFRRGKVAMLYKTVEQLKPRTDKRGIPILIYPGPMPTEDFCEVGVITGITEKGKRITIDCGDGESFSAPTRFFKVL